MNTRRGPQDLGWLRMMLASPWRVMCVVSAVFFLSEVQKFYDPNTGFSSLISIGDRVGENKVTQLKDVRHYVYEDSSGYDGAYYVQLALNPTLDNPELKTSIDNLPYRAKRILFCWTAWVLGRGSCRRMRCSMCCAGWRSAGCCCGGFRRRMGRIFYGGRR